MTIEIPDELTRRVVAAKRAYDVAWDAYVKGGAANEALYAEMVRTHDEFFSARYELRDALVELAMSALSDE